jgi:hypothetical protein
VDSYGYRRNDDYIEKIFDDERLPNNGINDHKRKFGITKATTGKGREYRDKERTPQNELRIEIWLTIKDRGEKERQY